MKIETINIDYERYKSIKNAETKKEQLENNGFNLIETKQNGFNKFCLIFMGVF